jgi:hypothetical protein
MKKKNDRRGPGGLSGQTRSIYWTFSVNVRFVLAGYGKEKDRWGRSGGWLG